MVIVVFFALMLTRIEDFRNLSDNKQWPLAGVIALCLFAVLAASAIFSPVPTFDREGVGISELGETLFTYWAVPFEVASLVLLVALIGAVVLVRRSDHNEEVQEEGQE